MIRGKSVRGCVIIYMGKVIYIYTHHLTEDTKMWHSRQWQLNLGKRSWSFTAEDKTQDGLHGKSLFPTLTRSPLKTWHTWWKRPPPASHPCCLKHSAPV